MIKVRDFAKECSCSAQNIYQHLTTYKEELDGHVFEGPRGKLLDDYACDFIRSIMNPKEIVADAEVQQQLMKAQARIVEVESRNSELSQELEKSKTANFMLQSELKEKERLLLTSQEQEELKVQELQAANEKNAALEAELEAQRKALDEEKNRKLTFKERLMGKKNV